MKLAAGVWAAVVAVLLMTGCVRDQVYGPHQVIRVETPAYVAELIHPETADFPKRNARFVEGGWMLSLTPRSTGENIFYDHTVIPRHNARGLAVEFMDAMPLGGDRFLRPGVGIVRRKPGKGRFSDRAVERFPWYSSVEQDDAGTTVHFHQYAPRFYLYTRTVRFENASRLITFTSELRNLGPAPLASQAFFHPFFRAAANEEPWCRIDSEPDFASPVHPPLPGQGEAFYKELPAPAGKPWFVCGAGDRAIAALSVANADTVGFWRERRPGIHVFAVEPFVQIAVPPWGSRKWVWGVRIP